MYIFKRFILKGRLNSYFVSTKAVNQEEHLPTKHPFVKLGKLIKYNNCCYLGLLIIPPDNIQ